MRAELYLGDANRANLDRLAALDNVDRGIADWPCPKMLQQVPGLKPAKLHICTAQTHRCQPSMWYLTKKTELGAKARALQRLIQILQTRHRQTICCRESYVPSPQFERFEKLQQGKLHLTRHGQKPQTRLTSQSAMQLTEQQLTNRRLFSRLANVFEQC